MLFFKLFSYETNLRMFLTKMFKFNINIENSLYFIFKIRFLTKLTSGRMIVKNFDLFQIFSYNFCMA